MHNEAVLKLTAKSNSHRSVYSTKFCDLGKRSYLAHITFHGKAWP